MDGESFKRTCIKEKGSLRGGGTHQPFYSRWEASFLLRQDTGRFMLEKYLSAKIFSMEVKETFGDSGGR